MINVSYLPLNAQEEFPKLSTDTDLKLQFSKILLNEFWHRIRTEFSTL